MDADNAARDAPAAVDRYEEELLAMSLKFRDMFLSYKNEVRKEKNGLAAQLERQLINMLETCDALAGYVRQYEGRNAEGFGRVQTIYLDMQQKLERAGVTLMHVENGEPYDEVRHEIVNVAARPGDFAGRPAVAAVAAPGYYLKKKVLRRARVEVDWVPAGKP